VESVVDSKVPGRVHCSMLSAASAPRALGLANSLSKGKCEDEVTRGDEDGSFSNFKRWRKDG
jgi:hypothetical protein